MIEVTPAIVLAESEFAWKAVRASGPGGQHVNKTSTAVELRFDVRGSPSLPEPVRARLYRLAGARLTQDGVLVITAQGFRSQEMNRAEALERLLALIRKAAEPPPPPRKKTRPTLASRRRRLAAKSRRGGVKAMRGKPTLDSTHSSFAISPPQIRFFESGVAPMVKLMSRATIFSALATATALAACAPSLGPPPPGGAPPAATFRAEDFAWSTEPGHGAISGHVAYRQGPVRYSCAKKTVILTPETPWTRRRMHILYGATDAAAEPAEEVRARTPSAPAGDYSAYVRRTTCDAASRFAFSGLPDGAWFAITIATPVSGEGPGLALMKRVVTRAGHVTAVAL